MDLFNRVLFFCTLEGFLIWFLHRAKTPRNTQWTTISGLSTARFFITGHCNYFPKPSSPHNIHLPPILYRPTNHPHFHLRIPLISIFLTLACALFEVSVLEVLLLPTKSDSTSLLNPISFNGTSFKLFVVPVEDGFLESEEFIVLPWPLDLLQLGEYKGQSKENNSRGKE
jgi:hypothetical protein